MKALGGPLDEVEFVPTGGIGLDNLAAFVDAGAVALGVGSALIADPAPSPDRLTEKARQMKAMLDLVRDGRP